MWKVIVANFLLLMTYTWLSIGIEGNPSQNNSPLSSQVRQLRLIRHKRHLISDNDVRSIEMSKIVKRSVSDISSADTERQSRAESAVDDNQKIPDNFKITAVENELGQLSDVVNSLANQTNNSVISGGNNSTRFWGVSKAVDGNEDYVSFQESPLLMLPETNETLAQFFGITNIYVGGQSPLINKKQAELTADATVSLECPVCPTVAAVDSLTLPEHIISTVTACESFGSSLGTCSVASIAPSGTIFILFSSSTSSTSSSGNGGRKTFGRYLKKKKTNSPIVATAVVGVVATAPNTKVKMTCPYIPTDVTVTTQNGPVLSYKPREEAGFIQLIVTGSLTSDKYTMACVWSSSP